MARKHSKGGCLYFAAPYPLPVVCGEEKCRYEAPKNIVDGRGKVASVREGEGDYGNTAHTDHCHNGVEDELKRAVLRRKY